MSTRRGLALLAVGAAMGVAFAGPAMADLQSGASSGRLQIPAGAMLIPDSYVVTLHDSPTLATAADVTTVADRLTRRHGGRVEHVYAHALRGFSATMPTASARRLAADPAVALVEQDQVMRLADTQTNATWGIDRIDQRALPLSTTYTYNTTASTVTAYVIDTGTRITHSDFGGRAQYGRDFIDNDNTAQDCNGHGTHVAGTVGGRTWGLAKGVQIYAVRVLDCAGSGSNSGVIAGVNWVTQNARKPAVANMSLGGGASSTLDNAVRSSIAAGVVYSLAAGNDSGNACNGSPGRTAEAITVGATTRSDGRASFSNYGTCLDIFAPGNGITSSSNSSDSATANLSGTSMAAPHVAGAAALLFAANPTATAQQIRDQMVGCATSGVVTSPGSGSPNKLLYSLCGSTPPQPGRYFENTADVQIPDLGTAESPVTVSGLPGNAPTGLKVGVKIKHTYRGDLVIDLVAPDGSAYRLKNSNGSDGTDNIDTVYTVDASAEVANGQWRLRVRDVYSADTGYIDLYSLQF